VAEITTASGRTHRYAGIVPADVPRILFMHFRAQPPDWA
jgi:hypothetical protein